MIDKTIRLGMVDIGDRRVSVFCRIKYTDGRLSITGVEGPKRNGDAWGACGQINMDLNADMVDPAPGWDRDTIGAFLDVWHAWHLNDMTPACPHQRAMEWDKRPIDPSKPLRDYGRHFEGQRQDSWNMLVWVRPNEHPDGLLGKPCPICGYRYGSAWLTGEVPPEVLEWLTALPDTDVTPAWV